MEGPRWWRRVNWHLFGRRPPSLKRFGQQVVDACQETHPEIVLTTGLAPVCAATLQQIRNHGLAIFNYLTDDPWNPAHRAEWFLQALPKYSAVFSPRRSNLRDLTDQGCKRTSFLPFAYDPAIHFETNRVETIVPNSEVLFVGGGDKDRAPYLMALMQAGMHLAIFGDYWWRYPGLTGNWKGYADTETARQVTCSTPVCLCLVRRANRDGHTMRTFEAAAMGACLLCEDTVEHREIFGRDGEAVLYFRSIPQMVDRAKWLLGHKAERSRMRSCSLERVTKGRNTYRDRLERILDECSSSLS